jgi:hypothetical protein
MKGIKFPSKTPSTNSTRHKTSFYSTPLGTSKPCDTTTIAMSEKGPFRLGTKCSGGS